MKWFDPILTRLDRMTAMAFEMAWADDAILPLLTLTAARMHHKGLSASQTLDAVDHGLRYDMAYSYLIRGLTGHQAALIENSPRAVETLFAEDDNLIGITGLMGIPLDYFTSVLLIAAGREEANLLFARYEAANDGDPDPTDGEPRTLDEVATLVHGMAALAQPAHMPACSCAKPKPRARRVEGTEPVTGSEALEVTWANDAVIPLLTPMARLMRGRGLTATQALDAIDHGLGDEACALLTAGFTGHQAALIENNHEH